jgi:hypothetical protein
VDFYGLRTRKNSNQSLVFVETVPRPCEKTGPPLRPAWLCGGGRRVARELDIVWAWGWALSTTTPALALAGLGAGGGAGPQGRMAGSSAVLAVAVAPLTPPTTAPHNAAKPLSTWVPSSGRRAGAPPGPVPTGPPPRVSRGLLGCRGGGGGWRPFKKKRVLAVEQSYRAWSAFEALLAPGTGFSMIWFLLRTVEVALLYLSVVGRAWRCSSAQCNSYRIVVV